MLLKEKAVVAAIKDAYRGGGYEVSVTEGRIYLRSYIGAWEIMFPAAIAPRKVLALLVEHIGKIPEESWRVQKELCEQIFPEEHAADTRDLREQARDIGETLERSNVTYGQTRIYKSDAHVIAIPQSFGDMADEKEADAAMGRRGVIWNDGSSILRVAERELPEHIKAALEGICSEPW